MAVGREEVSEGGGPHEGGDAGEVDDAGFEGEALGFGELGRGWDFGFGGRGGVLGVDGGAVFGCLGIVVGRFGAWRLEAGGSVAVVFQFWCTI